MDNVVELKVKRRQKNGRMILSEIIRNPVLKEAIDGALTEMKIILQGYPNFKLSIIQNRRTQEWGVALVNDDGSVRSGVLIVLNRDQARTVHDYIKGELWQS